jgi:hypothetical protein
MRRVLLSCLGAVTIAAVLAVASTVSAGTPTVLEFETMAPVTGPYVGTDALKRGVVGGGLPWQIASAKGELKASGELEVSVTGLVLLAAAPVPASLQGVNPIPTFRATVSCQSISATGQANVVNVTTDAFPATTGPAAEGGGNAKIEATVTLPHPCIAPIVFVRSGAGTGGGWFAATGAQ